MFSIIFVLDRNVSQQSDHALDFEVSQCWPEGGAREHVMWLGQCFLKWGFVCVPLGGRLGKGTTGARGT